MLCWAKFLIQELVETSHGNSALYLLLNQKLGKKYWTQNYEKHITQCQKMLKGRLQNCPVLCVTFEKKTLGKNLVAFPRLSFRTIWTKNILRTSIIYTSFISSHIHPHSVQRLSFRTIWTKNILRTSIKYTSLISSHIHPHSVPRLSFRTNWTKNILGSSIKYTSFISSQLHPGGILAKK